MFKDYCICRDKSIFIIVIDFNKSVFTQYKNIVIGKCKYCGILKTKALNSKFNAKTSESGFYENNRSTLKRMFEPIVFSVQKFKTSGRILDVGCATGILLESLKDCGFGTIGIEPNKNAYKIAKNKLGKNIYNEPSSVFYKNNKTKFDVIIYNHVLEHIHKIREELENLKKHLKVGGLLLINVPNTDNFVYKFRQEKWESLMPLQHVWHFNTNYLVSFLERSGFTFKEKQFFNHSRVDYPFIKKIYFNLLIFLNFLFKTGEAVLIVAQKAK